MSSNFDEVLRSCFQNKKRITFSEVFISRILFSDLSTYVNGLPVTYNSIDAFVMMSYRNNMAGIIGMAWVGTTCFSDKQFRTSITEYYQTQQLTAIVRYHFFNFLPFSI